MKLTRLLFWFTVAVLVVFGIGSLSTSYPLYAIAMFGDAVIIAFCAWQLSKKTKIIFYFSVLVLALNIILTIFDQFGLVDLLFVLLNIATLISLVITHKEFLSA